jgi:antitoxin component of MazEF toxin-antitoxin module
MKTIELKITAIGNSRGIRLPAETLKRYHMNTRVVMEERSDGILLRRPGPVVDKLSWEETAREMAADHEDWAAWETVAADGLDDIPWSLRGARRVAEPKSGYETRRRKDKR